MGNLCFLNPCKPNTKILFFQKTWEKWIWVSLFSQANVMFLSRYSLSSFKVPFSVNLSSARQANGPEMKSRTVTFSILWKSVGSYSVGGYTFLQAYLVLYLEAIKGKNKFIYLNSVFQRDIFLLEKTAGKGGTQIIVYDCWRLCATMIPPLVVCCFLNTRDSETHTCTPHSEVVGWGQYVCCKPVCFLQGGT